MLSIVRRRPLLSLILVLAGPAKSLDFSNDLVLYEEDFEGETSFPTTPEVNTIAAGGMGGFYLPSFLPPTLSGTAISESVPGLEDGDFQVGAIINPPGTIGTDSFNLRAEFSALSHEGQSPDPSVIDLFVGATFDSGEVSRGSAILSLRVDNFSTFEAQLIVCERDGSIPVECNNSLEVPVPTDAVAALFAGAVFVLDCQIDRAAETVTGSIEIDGFSPIIVGPMSFTVLSQTDPIINPLQSLFLDTGTSVETDTLVEVEFDSFRISQTQAAAMVPSLSPVSLALLAAALLGAMAYWRRRESVSAS
jgi:hypothetical protein